MTAQDQEATFRRWLDEHIGLMLKVVRGCAGSSQDQDVIQELWQSWGQPDVNGSVHVVCSNAFSSSTFAGRQQTSQVGPTAHPQPPRYPLQPYCRFRPNTPGDAHLNQVAFGTLHQLILSPPQSFHLPRNDPLRPRFAALPSLRPVIARSHLLPHLLPG